MNSIPYNIQSFEPTIGRCFVSDLSPYPFLCIQSRLVTWQIFYMQTFMSLYKNLNLFSLMPFCLINIQPYCISPQPPIKIIKAIQKSLSIAICRSNHTNTTQKGSNPAKNIEPLMVLAIGRDFKAHPLFSPSSAQSGMQSKTRFIFKNNGLVRLKSLKFFLTPFEIFRLLLSGTADRSNWHFLNDSLTDEANIEPVSPLSLPQNGVSGELPVSGHPTELDLYQNPKETSLNDVLIGLPFLNLADKDDQVWLWVVTLLILLRLPCASTDSNSGVSNPIPRLSIPDADPPVSAIEPLSLFQYRLPESFVQRLKDNHGLLRDALKLTSDFS